MLKWGSIRGNAKQKRFCNNEKGTFYIRYETFYYAVYMPYLIEPNESSGGQNKQGLQFDTADLN